MTADLTSLKNVIAEDDKNGNKVFVFTQVATQEDVDVAMKVIFDYEQETTQNCLTLIKALDKDLIVNVLDSAMNNENLKDVSLLLNIINLIKDDEFDDEFYDNDYICFSSREVLRYVREKLKDKIVEFRRKFALYFMSLFKSYNKLMYEPLDKHIVLPKVFEFIFRSNNLLSLSKIFALAPNIDTKDCIYIENANDYLLYLLLKEPMASDFLKLFSGEE